MKKMKKIMITALSSMLVLAGCSTAQTSSTATESTEAETETADVVIVGAGIAGLNAAMEFKNNYPDLKVVLLEQQGFVGGSALYSEGFVLGYADDKGTLSDISEVKKLFHTSSEIIEEYGFGNSGYEVNDTLVENVFGNMEEAYARLNEIGVNLHYEDMPYYNENSYDDDILCYASDGSGSGLVEKMTKNVEDSDIDLRLNSKVTELLADGNKVTGLTVESEDKTYTIDADYIILATGGMANNEELLKECIPNFANVNFEVNAGANGDAVTFTKQFNTPLIGEGVLGLISSEDDLYQLMQCNFMVDMNGNRFANESLNSYLLFNALQNLAEGEAYVIADSNYYEKAKEEVDYKLEAGTVTKYDTIDDVIQATGIDEEGLKRTIESYNASVDAGENPEFELDVDSANKVVEGPFYVEKASTYCYGTIRGLQVNDYMNIVNGDGDTVEGLYAAGEVAVGNVFSGQYAKSGAMLAFGINSGVLAAKQIGEALSK